MLLIGFSQFFQLSKVIFPTSWSLLNLPWFCSLLVTREVHEIGLPQQHWPLQQHKREGKHRKTLSSHTVINVTYSRYRMYFRSSICGLTLIGHLFFGVQQTNTVEWQSREDSLFWVPKFSQQKEKTAIRVRSVQVSSGRVRCGLWFGKGEIPNAVASRNRFPDRYLQPDSTECTSYTYRRIIIFPLLMTGSTHVTVNPHKLLINWWMWRQNEMEATSHTQEGATSLSLPKVHFTSALNYWGAVYSHSVALKSRSKYHGKSVQSGLQLQFKPRTSLVWGDSVNHSGEEERNWSEDADDWFIIFYWHLTPDKLRG